MRTTLEGTIRVGNVQSSDGDGYVTVEIEDKASDIEFIRIKLDYETFGRLISGNGSHKCSMEVWGLEHVGKVRQTVKATIHIDTSLYNSITDGKWDERHTKIADWLEAHHSVEGWIMSRYFGSRDSIVNDYNTGKTALNFTRTRWVDPSDA
jgi:hypothetical protein